MLKESLFLRHLKDYALRYSPNIITYNEPNGNYIFVNDTVEKILGYTPKELIGKNCYPFIHPGDQDFIEKESHSPVLKGEMVGNIRYRAKKKNGDYIWIESQVIPVKENNIVKKIISISRSIEEDQELKLNLQKEKKINHEISEVANIGHWSYNLVTGEITWSRKIYEIHGLDYDEPVDFNKAISFYSAESKRKIKKGVKEAIDKGIEYRVKLKLIAKNGKIKWVKAVGTPLVKKGKCVEIFGTFQDVTDMEETSHEKIFSLSEYLDGQNHLLKEFSQITSHDLRGPATGLKMLVDEIRETEDENLRNLIPYFDENLDKLFEKLNYLSKITSGQDGLKEDKKIDVQVCIDTVLEKNKEAIKEYNINVTKHYSDWSKIDFNKSKMLRVLQNLIENAIYYSDVSKKERRLRVRTYIKNNQRFINIEDNGLGMDLKKMEQQGFTRHTRLHGELSGKGSGIFLAKILLESSKAKMEFISKPGRGTVVRINLDKYRLKEELL